jgi:GNAT superfamily N-acetyltransferase
VAIRDDPERRGWRVLADGEGARLVRFRTSVHDGSAVTGGVERCPDVSVERAAAAVMAELRGRLVCRDVALGEALVAAGARAGRHAEVLSHDLRGLPAPSRAPDGVRIVPVDRSAADLAAVFRAAYPREHPDFRAHPYPEDPALELAPLLDGRLVGPLLGASALALDGAGRAVGAALVNRTAGSPPEAGPWLSQLFRSPTHPGTGRSLLGHVLVALAAADEPALGLAVTHGNPAARLYRQLGFRPAFSAFNVEL